MGEIQGSPQRAEEFTARAEAAGATVEGLYWTLGAYDGAIVLKAENDAAMTALMLSLNSRGFVKTESLRAFDRSEFEGVLARLS